jgi:hypothetical protein
VSGVPKMMVGLYANDIFIWEPNKCTTEKKFQRVVRVCKDFGLNVNLDRCVVMKISGKTRGMEKMKCNNYEIKSGELEVRRK